MSENDEKWVREFLVPHLLTSGKLVKNYSVKNSFTLISVFIEYLGTKEAFMLTTCYKAKINFEYCGDEYSKSLIVKKTPDITEDAYEAVNFDTLFHNEITAYTDIMPTLGYPDNYPEYFYSCRKKLEAVLVLGDFSIDGWRMTKSRVNLSLEHILLSVKYIARFHGKGLALKSSDSRKFFDLVAKLKEARYANTPPPSWAYILANCISRSIRAAKEQKPKIPESFLDELSELIKDVFTYGKQRVQPTEPLATISHGDFIRNNLAFRYNNKDVPVEVMMFDFQTLRYCSPMIDLTLFMSLSSGKDVRPKHFNEIFAAYWNELVTTYCNKLEISLKELPEFLSYERLLKQYILYLPFGLATASSFLMNLHEPEEFDPAELLQDQRTPEEQLEELLVKGGEIVDSELAALVEELYQFTTKYNINIVKDSFVNTE